MNDEGEEEGVVFVGGRFCRLVVIFFGVGGGVYYNYFCVGIFCVCEVNFLVLVLILVLIRIWVKVNNKNFNLEGFFFI